MVRRVHGGGTGRRRTAEINGYGGASKLSIAGVPGGSMRTTTTTVPVRREPELLGQTVVVIGGSAGIGLETARRARAEGARLILTGRDPERLQRAAGELEAQSLAAFDATDSAALERFFGDLPATIDHVMVTAG